MDQIKIDVTKNKNLNKIKSIEFQGEKVKICCNDKDNKEVYVLVDDNLFYKNNFEIGQRIGLKWKKNQSHLLE